MQYKICFYTTSWGTCYIRDYLDKVAAENLELFGVITAKLQRMQYPQVHKRPLVAKVTDYDFSEIRPGGRNTARIFFKRMPGQVILLMSGYTKKDDRLRRKDLQLAERISKDITEGRGSYEEINF